MKAIRLASNVALAAIPPPGVPGTLPAAINILKDVEDPLKGKINGIKNKVNAISNILDFLINDKVVLEIKAKRMILKEDFYQTQRYLQCMNKPLALLVNFRNRFLKPIRIVKIETDARKKFC